MAPKRSIFKKGEADIEDFAEFICDEQDKW